MEVRRRQKKLHEYSIFLHEDTKTENLYQNTKEQMKGVSNYEI